MAVTSIDHIDLLLRVVPYVQARGEADLAATARIFDVTPRRLVKDLNTLFMCGLPGGMPDDLIEIDQDALEAGVIRISNADYLTRPRRLTLTQAASLVVGLKALQETAGGDTAEAIRSALTKLEAVVAPGASGEAVAVDLGSGREGVRAQVLDAIERGVAVRLAYVDAKRIATNPVVDPVQVAARDGYAYLDAWSRTRDGWRSYRLDRIASVELTDDPVADHGTPPAQPGGWLDGRPDAVEVTLELAPSASWVCEYHPMRSVTRHDDGRVTATLLVADPLWFRELLLRLGAGVLAVEPAAAASSAGDEAREALAGYAEVVQ